MCPKCFLKITGKASNYLFYLHNSLNICDNISHKLLGARQILEKVPEIPKLVPKNSHVLPNSIDNVEFLRVRGLRNYVRYCSFYFLTKGVHFLILGL